MINVNIKFYQLEIFFFVMILAKIIINFVKKFKYIKNFPTSFNVENSTFFKTTISSACYV
jgi:hypothetical protein